MTILNARESNDSGTAIILTTLEAGAVALDLTVPEDRDISGGWIAAYKQFTADGGKTAQYTS